jgi:hypothetical protein
MRNASYTPTFTRLLLHALHAACHTCVPAINEKGRCAAGGPAEDSAAVSGGPLRVAAALPRELARCSVFRAKVLGCSYSLHLLN